MALSAVSRGVFTVGLTVGRVALTIAVDVITHLAFVYLIKMPARISWVVSSLPACTAVYLTSGVPKFDTSGIITCCLYVAYKALPWVPDLVPANPTKGAIPILHPSMVSLCNKYFQLTQRLTISFAYEGENKEFIEALDAFAIQNQDEIRRRWQDPETMRLADELIRKADKAMEELYRDLETAASQELPENRFKKMAEDLTSQRGPEFYYYRFCSQRTITLLDIYRLVRGLGFFIHCRHMDTSRFNVVNLSQLQEDTHPFFVEGAPQFEW